MKIPKNVKRYCPKCQKHTEHKVKLGKVGGKRGTLKAGQRRHERRAGVKGYGGSPQPKAAEKAKTSRRTPFIYTCTVCSKSTHKQRNIRAKKFVQA